MTAPTRSSSARLAAGSALIVSLLFSGGPALAAPATHSTDHAVNVLVSTGTDDAFVFASMTVSQAHGSGADVQIWLPPDLNYLDPPALVSGSDDLVLGPMDSSLTGSIQLIENASGKPAGVAVVDATLAPLGEPEVATSTALGNQKLRQTQVVQPLTVTGTITVPGANGPVAIPLDGSQATATDSDVFSNAPASTVRPIEFTALLNWWEVDGVLIGLAAESDRMWSYVEVAVVLPEGVVLNGTLEGARFDERGIDAEFELVASGQGFSATGGSASIQGTISVIDRHRSVGVDGDDRLQVTIEQLAATGTLNVSLDDGRSFSLPLEEISGSFYSYRELFRDGGRAG